MPTVTTERPENFQTIEQMRSRFAGEWVLFDVGRSERPEDVLGGVVLWHSPNRDEVYRKAIEMRPEHPAVYFFGDPPQGMEFLL